MGKMATEAQKRAARSNARAQRAKLDEEIRDLEQKLIKAPAKSSKYWEIKAKIDALESEKLQHSVKR